MWLQSGSGTAHRRLESAACRFTIWCLAIGMFVTLGLAPALSLAIGFSGPKAAFLRPNTPWEVSWQNLGQDDWCPTPSEGYCDASLVKRRLRLGPLEIRYSYSY